jgi:hypothetical protein
MLTLLAKVKLPHVSKLHAMNVHMGMEMNLQAFFQHRRGVLGFISRLLISWEVETSAMPGNPRVAPARNLARLSRNIKLQDHGFWI